MNRMRVTAVGAFTAVIVVLLAVIIYVETVNSGHTVKVWIVTADTNAGHTFTPDVVQLVQVKGQPGDFQFTTQQPSSATVFRLAMHKDDIVRDDDLLTASNLAQIPITINENINFDNSGQVDIYLYDTAQSCVQLLGTSLTVVSGGSSSLTIQVPRHLEAAWLVFEQANTTYKLIAVPAGGNPGQGKVCLPDAITQLAPNLGAVPTSPTPASTP